MTYTIKLENYSIYQDIQETVSEHQEIPLISQESRKVQGILPAPDTLQKSHTNLTVGNQGDTSLLVTAKEVTSIMDTLDKVIRINFPNYKKQKIT